MNVWERHIETIDFDDPLNIRNASLVEKYSLLNEVQKTQIRKSWISMTAMQDAAASVYSNSHKKKYYIQELFQNYGAMFRFSKEEADTCLAQWKYSHDVFSANKDNSLQSIFQAHKVHRSKLFDKNEFETDGVSIDLHGFGVMLDTTNCAQQIATILALGFRADNVHTSISEIVKNDLTSLSYLQSIALPCMRNNYITVLSTNNVSNFREADVLTARSYPAFAVATEVYSRLLKKNY